MAKWTHKTLNNFYTTYYNRWQEVIHRPYNYFHSNRLASWLSEVLAHWLSINLVEYVSFGYRVIKYKGIRPAYFMSIRPVLIRRTSFNTSFKSLRDVSFIGVSDDNFS